MEMAHYATREDLAQLETRVVNESVRWKLDWCATCASRNTEQPAEDGGYSA